MGLPFAFPAEPTRESQIEMEHSVETEATDKGNLESTSSAEVTETVESEAVETPGKSATQAAEEFMEEGTEGKTEEEQAEETSETETEGESAEEELQVVLPKQQMKQYPKALMEHYAKRFGFTEADLGDPRLAHAVKSKIDADIYAEQLKAQIPPEETEAEEEEAVEGQEAAPEEKLTPEAEEAQFRAHLDTLDRAVNDPRINNPKMVDAMAREYLSALGYKKADVDNLMQNGRGPRMIRALSKGALNLTWTVVPEIIHQILPKVMEDHFPGLGTRMYDRVVCGETWSELKETKAEYANLPEYGSKEFKAEMKKVIGREPDLESMVFVDRKTGQPLKRSQQIAARYRRAAALMLGQVAKPEAVEKAFEQGKKAGSKTTAGNRLGAGKTTGKFAPKQDANVGDELVSAYKDSHHTV